MYTLYTHIVRLVVGCLILPCFSAGNVFGQDYEVELTPFNSAHSDFGAVRYKDGVVFCSNRTKKKLSFDEDSINFYTDMFFSRLGGGNNWSGAELFSTELTDFLNEGPAAFNSSFDQIYYTTNFLRQRSSRRERVDEYVLGIQGAKLENGIWVKNDLFPFNAPKQDYNVAHPCVAPNDSVIYFASNMPGGQGGMDLYKCYWRYGRWSQPINLGPGINTKGDELFPFVSADNHLYFSTNGRNEKGKKQVDIYFCEIKNAGYSEPVAMPYPINTEHDDFAYAEFSGAEFGVLSSNRKNERDMIYSFRMNTPNFVDCMENERTVLCYTIEDIRLSPIDSLPLIYEWNLGDGNKARGLAVDHCYDKPGTYHVSLNVIDTLTRSTFFAVSEAKLHIPDLQQPFIVANDTLLTGQQTIMFADISSIKKYTVDKIYWIIDHDKTYMGDSLPYAFMTPGYHSVICGITGKDNKTGQRIKTCTFKEIFVTNDNLPGFPKGLPDPNARPVMRIRMKENFDPFASHTPAELAPAFHIVLAQGKSRMKADDLAHNYPGFQIKETKTKKGEYIYTLAESKDLSKLLPVFQELQQKGHREARVEIFNEPALEGVDWKALRKQDMVEYTSTTKEDIAYMKTKGIDLTSASASELLALNRKTTLMARPETNSTMDQLLAGGASVNASTTDMAANQHDAVAVSTTGGSAEPGLPATAITNASSQTAVTMASGVLTGNETNSGQTAIAPTETNNNSALSTANSNSAVSNLNLGNNNSGVQANIAGNAIETTSMITTTNSGYTAVSGDLAQSPLPSTQTSQTPLSLTQNQNPSSLTTEITGSQAQLNPSNGSAANARVSVNPATQESITKMDDQMSTGVAGSSVTGYVAGEQVSIPDARTGSTRSIQVLAQDLFHVIIIESPIRIPLNDPFFSRIHREIVEIEGMPDGFTYCVGLSKDSKLLEPLVSELHENGYNQASIKSFSSDELSRHIVRKGRYIPPKDAARLNMEFSKLQDIKFEYNSAIISEESRRNLDYIAAMLLLEDDFDLKISAHTCTIGSHAFNQQLSEQRAKSVVEYFASKGIRRERLHAKGFAATKPLAENESEEGRRENRRVEFVIVFHPTIR